MEVIKVTNFYDKLKGLMFEEEVKPILLQTRFGIHTFFLKKPIDVVILSRDHVVQKLRRNLKPYNFFFWNPKFDLVLECPLGTINKQKIKVGEKIIFSNLII